MIRIEKLSSKLYFKKSVTNSKVQKFKMRHRDGRKVTNLFNHLSIEFEEHGKKFEIIETQRNRA
jgi:hypothetical protein